MGCNKYIEFIIPYAEGTLSTSMMEEMASHLSACPECQRELDEVMQTIGILRGTEFPQIEPAFDLRSRVLARIANETPARKPKWYGRLSFISAAAAGLLFICVGITVYYTTGGPYNKSMAVEDAISASAVRHVQGGARQSATEAPPAPGTPSIIRKPAESNRMLPGSNSALMAKGAVDKTSRQGAMAHKEKPPMIARVGSGHPSYQNAKDQARMMQSETGALGGMPSMANKSEAPDGAAKQRAVDDRVGMNAMAPGGAQVQQQQQGMASEKADRRGDKALNAAEKGFGAPEAANASLEPKREAGEDVLTLERKLAAFPNSITVMKQLLVSYRSVGRAQDEYAMAERLTQADPDNSGYWFARGQAAERAKMPKTAVTCYQTAISKHMAGPELDLAKSRLDVLGRERKAAP